MVRLRRSFPRPLYPHRWRFQSHYGAIATQAFGAGVIGTDKVSIPLWCDCDYLEANSKGLGRRSFNPTMVRLRPSVIGLFSSPRMWFQSHYGAIATAILRVSEEAVTQFQSHYGAIATRIDNSTSPNFDSVSIPLWCDCDQTL